ncbi:CBS domain-containing protein [Leptobacterium sp. I13]|uniref:CBS domain-containing protein n=1 Tax=Leptobacterium meishanense TaxID=3128904 RepID=UPI0030EC8A28
MANTNAYIRYDIQPLTPTTSVADVKAIFAVHTYTHMPVVENDFLIGNISEDDIPAFEDEHTIEEYRYTLDAFFVKKDTIWLDVLEAFARHDTNVMPVLDEKNEYIGYYELIDIVSLFNETPFLNEPGGILVVEKGMKDYSFSEVAQIIESNEGKLLGAFISDSHDDIVQITVKISGSGLNAIMQSFRRYNYVIISGNEDDLYLEELKTRSDYLKKFLDI